MKVSYSFAEEMKNETQYTQDDHVLDCLAVAVIGIVVVLLKHSNYGALLELIAFLVLAAGNLFQGL